MRKRNLSDKQIRALAYEVAADELQASIVSSEHMDVMCRDADGTDDDLAALERRLETVAKMLRKRAADIRGYTY